MGGKSNACVTCFAQFYPYTFIHRSASGKVGGVQMFYGSRCLSESLSKRVMIRSSNSSFYVFFAHKQVKDKLKFLGTVN